MKWNILLIYSTGMFPLFYRLFDPFAMPRLLCFIFEDLVDTTLYFNRFIFDRFKQWWFFTQLKSSYFSYCERRMHTVFRHFFGIPVRPNRYCFCLVLPQLEPDCIFSWLIILGSRCADSSKYTSALNTGP